MKTLFALLGLSAMIWLAAPAHAHPDEGGGDDVGFLAALQNAGITYSNPDQAIGSAKAVCWCLDGGESGLELVHDMKTHNPGFNMEAASQFAVLAATYYCPHHLSHA
ncbi:putative membrane protein [Mycobacterium liflandii 128FXT]|uniref:Membrane protein n=2 Tax=Mycobacterium liflandii TaxID=261524 RepID=L7VA24_MYCL1|nr:MULTISPECIES: DUF732 domain-containing protein [Mycobacterium ulcerans group]AGC62264.1 putative membrane protein [Mycobacterium liflandii 128FXT]RFZ50475.1 hypothetical protein BB170200_05245 [Mycobacterium marinum]ULL10525.1 DUF732 domain-containing protein [Mycobacterium liflandii]